MITNQPQTSKQTFLDDHVFVSLVKIGYYMYLKKQNIWNVQIQVKVLDLSFLAATDNLNCIIFDFWDMWLHF